MNFAAVVPSFFNNFRQSNSPRPRLYGLCILVSLSVLLAARLTNDLDVWVPTYLPLAGLTLFALSIAGIECGLFIRHVTEERAALAAERARAETSTLDRQRTFNVLWQSLADSRGAKTIPEPVLQELAGLFSADLVAVWAAEKEDGVYRVAGTFPIDPSTQVRLEKVANGSPCFDVLRNYRRQMKVTDFKRETTPAFAWFCEENQLQMAVLCPVLVRANLVGVMALFYKQKPKISNHLAEEMNSAANLFLCAL